MPICRQAALRFVVVAGLIGSTSSALVASPADIWWINTCIPAQWGITPASRNVPRTVPAGPRLAQPTAAPPSADKPVSLSEVKPRPVPPPGPAVAESSKPEQPPQQGVAVEEGPSYDIYPIMLKEKPINDQSTVTFQNLAGKPLKIIVDNRDQELTDKQSVTLTVPRQFSWRVEGREPRVEQIGKNDYAVQIVIRR